MISKEKITAENISFLAMMLGFVYNSGIIIISNTTAYNLRSAKVPLALIVVIYVYFHLRKREE